jgi:hypothetical protein
VGAMLKLRTLAEIFSQLDQLAIQRQHLHIELVGQAALRRLKGTTPLTPNHCFHQYLDGGNC